MRVIIPCAGKGTRLKPLTDTTPKILLKVAGKPVLGHILDWLVRRHISEVILVSPPGEMGDDIYGYALKYGGDRYRFSDVRQAAPEGQGHAIWLGLKCTQPADPVLIINGDSIPYEADATYFWILNFGDGVLPDTSILGVHMVDDCREHSEVKWNENWYLSSIVEKPENPTSNYSTSGVYYFRESRLLYDALDFVIRDNKRINGEFNLTSAIQDLQAHGERFRIEILTTLDTGSFEGLDKAEGYFGEEKQ